MAKTKNKQKRVKKTAVVRVGGPGPVRTGNRMASFQRAMSQYDRLIRDPCGGDFCYAPYFGTDSGYLMRTIENVALTDNSRSGLTVGGNYAMSGVFAYAPGHASSTQGLTVGGTSTPGTVMNPSTSGPNVWPVTTTATVARFRPIAACVKFIPSGPYQTRRGMIGLGYQNSPILSTFAITAEQVSRNVLRLAPVGSEPHEVRWLPAETDHLWAEAAAVTAGIGKGTVYGCVLDVDGTASSATQVVANGYLEITTVWEWVPYANSGLCTAPRAPLPFTTQEYLSTIDNIGNFVLTGVRQAARVAGAHAATSFVSYLTRGFRQSRRGQDSMPMIRDEL